MPHRRPTNRPAVCRTITTRAPLPPTPSSLAAGLEMSHSVCSRPNKCTFLPRFSPAFLKAVPRLSHYEIMPDPVRLPYRKHKLPIKELETLIFSISVQYLSSTGLWQHNVLKTEEVYFTQIQIHAIAFASAPYYMIWKDQKPFVCELSTVNGPTEMMVSEQQ